MTAERVGAPVGYGFHIIDHTPYTRGPHHLELANHRTVYPDKCNLASASDRKRWKDNALGAIAGKRKPKGERIEAVLVQLYAASTAQRPAQPEESNADADQRPAVDIGEGDLSLLTRSLSDAVKKGNAPPSLFAHGDTLARIATDEDGQHSIEALDLAGVTYECAERVQFYKETPRGHAAVPPPPRLIQNYVAGRQWGVPHLRAVTTVPAFAANGSLIIQPGYNAASRLIYRPACGFDIPAVPSVPTDDDLARARGLILDDLLHDFPFARESDKAHAVSTMVEPFVRAMIHGPTPMHGFEAPSAGTGKGLLASVLCLPYGGHLEVSVLGGTEEEIRKQITAVALESPSFYMLDNVEEELNSRNLSAALTSTVWKDRILGQSKMAHLPIRWTWLMTATNPAMGTQMARRYVRCRLDAKVEEPWRRTGFKHDDLPKWVAAQRGELIWACLILVQNWLAKGRPESTARLGTYENWSKIVGGILATAGIEGFLDDLDQLYDRADAQRGTWRAFIAQWVNTFGIKPVKVSELWPLAVGLEDWDWGRSETEQGQKIALGRALANKEGYVIGGYAIIRGRSQDGVQTWQLRPTSASTTGDGDAADTPDDTKVF